MIIKLGLHLFKFAAGSSSFDSESFVPIFVIYLLFSKEENIEVTRTFCCYSTATT